MKQLENLIEINEMKIFYISTGSRVAWKNYRHCEDFIESWKKSVSLLRFLEGFDGEFFIGLLNSAGLMSILIKFGVFLKVFKGPFTYDVHQKWDF